MTPLLGSISSRWACGAFTLLAMCIGLRAGDAHGAAIPASTLAPASGAMAATPADPALIRVSLGAVSPGVVTTGVVAVPRELREGRGGPLRYRIEPLAGARIYGALEGEISDLELDDPILPITYSVSRLQLAGPVLVARVDFESETGSGWSAELEADVVNDYRLELRVATPNLEAEIGDRIEIRFSLLNLGNVSDSVVVEIESDVVWQTEGAFPTPTIAPGHKYEGSLVLRVPNTAKPGDRPLLRVVARGRGSVLRAEVLVSISFPEVPANYEMPIRIFTGASGGSGRPGDSAVGWALSGSGEVANATFLSLSLRTRSDLVSRPAFAGLMSGPAFWGSIQRPRWQLAVGEIFQGGDAVTGGRMQGVGATGSWRAGALSGTAAYAEAPSDAARAGRVMSGNLAWRTGIGDLGFAARSESRPGRDGAADLSLDGGVLTFRTLSGAWFRGDASAGMLRMSTPQGEFVRPVARAELSRMTDRGSLTLRVRRSPTEADFFEARSSELFAGATVELGYGLALAGWYAEDELASRIPGEVGRTTAASAGLRYGLGRFQAAARAAYRQTNLPAADSVAAGRTSLAIDLSAPLGPVSAMIIVERGLAPRGAPIEYLQGSLRHGGGGAWTALAGTYSAGLGAEPITRLDLVESRQIGRLRFDLAAGAAPTARWRETLSAWSKGELALGRATTMTVGAEYAPLAGAESPIRFSIGLGRTIGIPLPTRRPSAISGVAFHDLNGDGIRSADEPGFAGLVLRQGSATATADGRGIFELRGDATGGPLTIESHSLPAGFTVDLNVLRRTGRGMEIPLVRTAGLSLALFIDADRSGERDAGEAPGLGLALVLTHESGLSFSDAVDAAGRLRFETLPPGSYRGRVVPAEGIHAVDFDFHLAPGSDVTIEVPVIKPEREIRFTTPAVSP